MLHRTTWIAIPVVGALILGASVGWWGYFDQAKQRSDMALQTENLYSNAFHNLSADLHDMDTELGKSVITADRGTFDTRLRNIWRLSFAAQTEAAKLPISLMPMHHTQKFLSNVGTVVDGWLMKTPNPESPQVHKQLQTFYEDAAKLSGELSTLQDKVLTQNLTWTSVAADSIQKKTDNQIVDNFRRMDTAASAFVESDESPSSMQKGRTTALLAQPVVSPTTALKTFGDFSGIDTAGLAVKSTNKGAYTQDYIIDGSNRKGVSVYAVISKHGGHILQFSVRRIPGTRNYDFVEAQQKAQAWLTKRGFGTTVPLVSNQYDHIGYFVLAPLYQGIPNISQGLMVKVALDNGNPIAFDASNYFYYPVKNLPPRKYSAQELQSRLNPALRVRMSREVIALDDQDHYQPAVAFYGTSNKETYCVYVNANTGRELDTDQLTFH